MYDINKMKLQYIDLHVQQLQVRFLLLLLERLGGGLANNTSYETYAAGIIVSDSYYVNKSSRTQLPEA